MIFSQEEMVRMENFYNECSPLIKAISLHISGHTVLPYFGQIKYKECMLDASFAMQAARISCAGKLLETFSTTDFATVEYNCLLAAANLSDAIRDILYGDCQPLGSMHKATTTYRLLSDIANGFDAAEGGAQTAVETRFKSLITDSYNFANEVPVKRQVAGYAIVSCLLYTLCPSCRWTP